MERRDTFLSLCHGLAIMAATSAVILFLPHLVEPEGKPQRAARPSAGAGVVPAPAAIPTQDKPVPDEPVKAVRRSV